MEDPSVLQRILAMYNDSKMATVLALDLFLVGIDTVRFCYILDMEKSSNIFVKL